MQVMRVLALFSRGSTPHRICFHVDVDGEVVVSEQRADVDGEAERVDVDSEAVSGQCVGVDGEVASGRCVDEALSGQSDGMDGNPEGFGVTGDEVMAEPTPEKLLEIQSLQRQDPAIMEICCYLEHGQLPDGERESKRLVLESPKYTLIQGVLHMSHRLHQDASV